MKKKLTGVCSAAILASVVAVPTAVAESSLTGNLGFVSDYYFRGVALGDAGVYAGLDFEVAGFYVGTWWIDDGFGEEAQGNDGLETDFYLGYGFEAGDFSISGGYNLYEYTYTSDFEHELILSIGFGPVGFEIVSGEDDDDGADATDYMFYAVSLGFDWFGATVGRYEDDDLNDEYNYVEVSASGTLADFDLGVYIGTQFDAEEGGQDVKNRDGYIVLDISRSFDLL